MAAVTQHCPSARQDDEEEQDLVPEGGGHARAVRAVQVGLMHGRGCEVGVEQMWGTMLPVASLHSRVGVDSMELYRISGTRVPKPLYVHCDSPCRLASLMNCV